MANAYLIASTFALMAISFGWGIAFKILWKEYRKQELREERTAKQEVEEKKERELLASELSRMYFSFAKYRKLKEPLKKILGWDVEQSLKTLNDAFAYVLTHYSIRP